MVLVGMEELLAFPLSGGSPELYLALKQGVRQPTVRMPPVVAGTDAATSWSALSDWFRVGAGLAARGCVLEASTPSVFPDVIPLLVPPNVASPETMSEVVTPVTEAESVCVTVEGSEQASDSGSVLADEMGCVESCGDTQEGCCYLSLVRVESRARAFELLGPWPTLRALVGLPMGWLIEPADAVGIGVVQRGTVLHVCEGTGSFAASDLLFIAWCFAKGWLANDVQFEQLMSAVLGGELDKHCDPGISEDALAGVAERYRALCGSEVTKLRRVASLLEPTKVFGRALALAPSELLSKFETASLPGLFARVHQTGGLCLGAVLEELLGIDCVTGIQSLPDVFSGDRFRLALSRLMGDPYVVWFAQSQGHHFLVSPLREKVSYEYPGGEVHIVPLRELPNAVNRLIDKFGVGVCMEQFQELRTFGDIPLEKELCPTCGFIVRRHFGHAERCRPARVHVDPHMVEDAWIGDVVHRLDVRQAILRTCVPVKQRTIVEGEYVKGTAQASYAREFMGYTGDLDAAGSTYFEAGYMDVRGSYMVWLSGQLGMTYAEDSRFTDAVGLGVGHGDAGIDQVTGVPIQAVFPEDPGVVVLGDSRLVDAVGLGVDHSGVDAKQGIGVRIQTMFQENPDLVVPELRPDPIHQFGQAMQQTMQDLNNEERRLLSRVQKGLLGGECTGLGAFSADELQVLGALEKRWFI